MADGSDSSDNGPIHHPSLYFPDGDIIFSVLNEGHPTLLRVHRVVLSHFSVTFRDILSIPSHSEANEMQEGVPVVSMLDPYIDFVGLINALYSPETLPLRDLERRPNRGPVTIRGICALAKKYQVDSVLKRIAGRLEAIWPTTLRQYVAARGTFTSDVGYVVSHLMWARVEHAHPEPALAIRLAMEVGARSVLPAAFYRLAISDPSVDWDDSEPEEMDTLSARWGLLDQTDWTRYNYGKDDLAIRFQELPLDTYEQEVPPGRCGDEDGCVSAIRKLRAFHRGQLNIGFARQPDIIGRTLTLHEEIDKGGFCFYCKPTLQVIVSSFLKDVWDDLSEIFGLTE